MAPRELPIVVGLLAALSALPLGVVWRVVPKPHPLAAIGEGRAWTGALAIVLLGAFFAAVGSRWRELRRRGLVSTTPRVVPSYREDAGAEAGARRKTRLFVERVAWASAWLCVCLGATFVRSAPLVWHAWLAALATAGAVQFVRWRDGADWSVALPFLGSLAYLVSGHPLVGLPQVLLFAVCRLIAWWQERADPSCGWAR